MTFPTASRDRAVPSWRSRGHGARARRRSARKAESAEKTSAGESLCCGRSDFQNEPGTGSCGILGSCESESDGRARLPGEGNIKANQPARAVGVEHKRRVRVPGPHVAHVGHALPVRVLRIVAHAPTAESGLQNPARGEKKLQSGRHTGAGLRLTATRAAPHRA